MAKEASIMKNKFSFKAFSDFVNANFSLIILLVMAFVLGFLTGSLWKENSILKQSGTKTAATDTTGTDTADAEAAAKKKLENVPVFDPEKDHYRGNKDAKVVLVEYSDYECPYCNRFHPTMVSLLKEHENDVVWVYRHFPLSFHPNAQPLAEAAECVAKYGSEDAFWKFSDSVYEKMATGALYNSATDKTVSEETILSLAVTSGANRSQVKSCIDSHETAQIVKDDQAGGSKAGITGTPGTIVVSQKGGFELIPGALSLDQVDTILANHL